MNGDSMLFPRMASRIVERLPRANRGRAVLVTSARRGEGKSYIAARLATALVGQIDGAIALVECSTGSPGSSDGTVASISWTDLVTNRSRAVPPPAILGAGALVRIPCGNGEAAPPFRSAGIAYALNLLRERFAFVVLDGPILSDTGVLSACSDGSVIVINARRTRREVVRGSLRAYPIVPEKLLGGVLNEAPRYVPKWLYRRAL